MTTHDDPSREPLATADVLQIAKDITAGTVLAELPQGYRKQLAAFLVLYHAATREGPHIELAFTDMLLQWTDVQLVRRQL